MKLQSAVIAVFLLLPTAKGYLPQADPSPWEEILHRYVNQQHLVDYAKLKAQSREQLQAYIASLGRPGTEPLLRDTKEALLINAYNAMTVEWIVENYPTKSIWHTRRPFKARRFRLAGEAVSLDGIESRLREMKDPRIHAAVICASGSCPPLRREAYVSSRLDQQLDVSVREWLANPSLNRFNPGKHEAVISPIFKWYRKDFDSYPGGLRGFLIKFGPLEAVNMVRGGKFTIHFKTYNWGLNDQVGRGKSYSELRLGTNWLEDRFHDWFANLGTKYNVDPVMFGGIYLGTIPFFALCVAWIIHNLRRKRSVVIPLLAASFFFISSYLYLLIVGRNIPAWVYIVIAATVGVGLYSTIMKIRSKASLEHNV